jgi:prepilin peptidase CpaA
MWTILLLIGAVITDLTSRRISNRMISLGILTGLFFQIWELGVKGIAIFLIQVSLPVILLYLMFLVRALGAGDIKLFSVVGSIWNFRVLFSCLLCSFTIGAIMSLYKLLRNKNLLTRLNYFCEYMRDVFITRTILPYERQSDGKQNLIHFSIPILFGFFIALCWR